MFTEPPRRRNKGFFLAPKQRSGTLTDSDQSYASPSHFPRRASTLQSDHSAIPFRPESPMPMDYAHPPPQSGPGPELTFTQPTPPVHPTSDLPPVPENGGTSRKGSTLGPNRQRSNTANSSSSWQSSATGWVAAVNQAVQRDNDFVDEWQRSMDVLLIFATLFAAIVTAFLIETYKDLRGQNETMIALLSEISDKLGSGTSTAIHAAAAESSHETSRSRVLRVNRLWFASLAITIGTSIFAMLAKQWISEYTEGLAIDPRHTSKQRLLREARLREFRFTGLRQWYVPEIIGALPIMLHVALLLFGVGLVDFFWVLDRGTSIIVLVFVVIIYVLYVGTVITPVFFANSPYRTPLSHLLANIMRTVTSLFYPSMRAPYAKPSPEDPYFEQKRKLMHGFTANGALLEAEAKRVERDAHGLDTQFLLRLKGTTRSDTIAVWADEELRDLEEELTGRRPAGQNQNQESVTRPPVRSATVPSQPGLPQRAPLPEVKPEGNALGFQPGAATEEV